MSLQAAIAGLNPGQKIVTGSFTPTAASTLIAWGPWFHSVDKVYASLEAADLTHMFTTCGVVGANLAFFHWKPTASGNVTPIGATTPWNVVNWLAIGDAPR